MGNRWNEEHAVKPVPVEAQRLPVKAFNHTPRGIPLDEWNKMQNAAKRERRRRKGKR